MCSAENYSMSTQTQEAHSQGCPGSLPWTVTDGLPGQGLEVVLPMAVVGCWEGPHPSEPLAPQLDYTRFLPNSPL